MPDERLAYRTKPEIALAELDPLQSAGVTWGCVLANAGYGISAAFRQALSARGLTWAVGIPRIQKVYPADVTTTIQPGRRCACWPGRSRRAGAASRRTSNSRKNSGSTTSRGAPGSGCTTTRC